MSRLFMHRYQLVNLSILLLAVSPVKADQHPDLFGSWGTEQQCIGELITPKGTKRAAPFIIDKDWLAHGEVWCRLNWLNITKTDDGVNAQAIGLCGEDTESDYRIRFILSNNELTLVWNLWHENGPLKQCERQNMR